MGAVLASMRASEQIDALESLSIDSLKAHYFVDFTGL
jgi:ABC-type transporter Mla maintaining outer membrane lipid asymmetry permease subunit MlaE